jgi:16S rRNA (guanine966-N2)-methyltransferase
MNKAPPGKLRIIAGAHRGRKVPVLSMKALRPTPDRVRETLFNWLQSCIHGARCLNFYAGTGILGFEALSRGASEVVMVDMDRKIIDSLTRTRADLGIDATSCPILHANVLSWIEQAKAMRAYDLIFLDPPFDSDLLAQSLVKLQASSLLGEKTKIYTELPVKAEPPTIEGFEVIKSQKAGQVGYYLFAAR